jgi:competence protein ComGC
MTFLIIIAILVIIMISSILSQIKLQSLTNNQDDTETNGCVWKNTTTGNTRHACYSCEKDEECIYLNKIAPRHDFGIGMHCIGFCKNYYFNSVTGSWDPNP